MTAEEFLTSASVAYTLLMIAIILMGIFVFVSQPRKKKKQPST